MEKSNHSWKPFAKQQTILKKRRDPYYPLRKQITFIHSTTCKLARQYKQLKMRRRKTPHTTYTKGAGSDPQRCQKEMGRLTESFLKEMRLGNMYSNKPKRQLVQSTTAEYPAAGETRSATCVRDGDVAQLVEHRTGTLPTQVRFPGAAKDFLPVTFLCRLSYGVRAPPCATACIFIFAHVKDPAVHVRVRWTMETLKHPACTVG